jgi:hypothetical protein
MRIVKYIFLLFLLTLATASVFVATKDGNFYIKKNKLINLPKEKLFNYIADFKNWENFDDLKQNDTSVVFQYPSKTSGTKSYFAWSGNTTDGKITSIFIKPNDSISQNLICNDQEAKMYWKFKDSLNKTKVTLSIKGSMSFSDKFKFILRLGNDSKMKKMFESTLENLNTVLTTQINTFKINVIGIVQRDTTVYLQSLASCTIHDLPSKIKKLVPKLKKLVSITDTKTIGSPFIVYHSSDTLTQKIIFSVAIPVVKKVYTSEGSDILAGQIMPFMSIKATLEGDYSHKKDMLKQINDYITKNKLEYDPKFKVIEILKKSILTDSSPAKWITDIYVPVRPKKTVIKAKPIKKEVIKSISNNKFNDTAN